MTEALVEAPTRRALAGARVRRAVRPELLFWLLISVILVVPIVVFLSAAVFPGVWGIGTQSVSVGSFRQAFSGDFKRALADSVAMGIVVSLSATATSLLLAWIVNRTNALGRRLVAGAVMGLLLTPSYLIALGWERLFEPLGVLDVMGWPTSGVRGVLYSPIGVWLVLTVKGVPFGYLAITGALRALGQEFEEAVRVHGGGPAEAFRVVVSLLSPAVWSSLAIVFAEAIGDFGVATTLARASSFPVATYSIYNAVEAFPSQFDVAAATSLVLLGLVGLALLAQTAALKGRNYQTLGARSRAVHVDRMPRAMRLLATLVILAFLVVSLGVPAFGAVSASLISDLGRMGGHSITLENYRHALQSSDLRSPLLFSGVTALIVATLAVLLATVCARIMARGSNSPGAKLLDLVLTGTVALPGIVFGAGYIFFFNLKAVNDAGIHLYGTTALLALAYLASGLPSSTRLLFGNVSQLRASMVQSARVHGATSIGSWLGVLVPLLARPMLSAWMLSFAHIVLELPISQLLYPPSHLPVAVGIQKALDQYDFGGATAMQVLAILFSLAVMGIASLLFRLFAPKGWQRIGKASA